MADDNMTTYRAESHMLLKRDQGSQSPPQGFKGIADS